jgi:predicted kinase
MEEEKRKAIAEAQKEVSQDVLDQREYDQEDAYQDMLLKKKAEFKLITDEELAQL